MTVCPETAADYEAIRFSFHHTDALSMEGVPPEVFLVLPLDATIPHGKVSIHPGFFVQG